MSPRRIIVVGAGINGLCAAWALARAGHRVTVLDAAPIPNTTGTSYDQHRLIRTAYGDQAGYARMMSQAWSAWNMLWTDLGAAHVARIGSLSLCTAPEDWTARSARTLDRLGFSYERIAPPTLATRFPMLRTGDALFGLYEEAAGALFADRIMDDLAGWLCAHDVVLRGGTKVAEVDAPRGSVLTESGEYLQADAVIVTAGTWAERLFPTLAGVAPSVRQVVAYVAPPVSLAAAWERAPVMLDLGGPRGMYLAPPVAGRGFKIGCGAYNRPWPLDEPADAQAEDGPALLAFYRERFTLWEEFRVLALRVCRYAAEPRQRFLLRRFANTWVLTGCSGHGFKFGPLMGLALAEAATTSIPGDDALLSAWAAGEEIVYAPALLRDA